MKKNSGAALLVLIVVFSSAAHALDLNNPLPNWLDPSREQAGKPLPGSSSSAIEPAVPPAGFRIPAEYEPVGAVVISWAGYTDMLTSVARAVTGPGKAQVFGVWAPETLPGVPAGRYKALDIPVDTVWVRDYGPFGLTGPGRLGIVDSVYRHYQYRQSDDAMPASLGKTMGVDVFGVKVILDGGNIMFDSKGNLFMTRRTYSWNSSMSQEQVDAALKAQFKAKNIYTFDYAGYPGQPKDGTGHIDMFMKLLNDHTVLISAADSEPFKSNSEKAQAWFRGRTAADGQPYRILTIKGWENSGTWYTYTNSLIVNNTVLMPSYSGRSAEEAQAAAAYSSGMPGVSVIPINSDSSITAGGSIHCVTQTIPALPAGRPGGFPVAAPQAPARDFSYAPGEVPALARLENQEPF
ncbi:MAG: hypothetical protein A2234_04260 [Elusimicrobia bacterium RIFOXYA2_FULL_58_8]|nr:MAG: hypothetical protein A2285_01075 [Elusimicrobia bacterium RIFOXYA12_FULL_57_11]OGS16334.1 MAG: hypothetical protein A2234_04260 [Elusimicrobia bacterium RIFOXYA2_FULL_58_8]